MRLGRPAADLFTLKYQTKHFLSCEVSIKQDSEEKSRAGGIRFTGRKLLRRGQKKPANIKNTIHLWTVACKLGLTFESAHRVCFIPMHEVCVTFVSTNVTHIFLHA